MNPFCEAAVQEVADRLGKKIPASYMRGIDDKFASTARYLASIDKDGFRSKTAEQRMEAVAEVIERDIKHKAIKDAQRIELNAISQKRQEGILASMIASGRGGIDSLEKMIGFVAETGERKSIPLESAIQAKQNEYLRPLAALLEADRGAHFLGFLMDPERSKLLIRELYGENTGNADAKLLADTYRKVNKTELDDFNNVGGDMHMLEGHIPQHLDPMALWGDTFDWSGGIPKRLTKEQRAKRWVDFEITKVDRNRMVDLDGKPMSDDAVRAFLTEAWWTRVTDGSLKSLKGGKFSSGVANRHKAHRIIHYKDAASYMEVMEKGRGGNIFENITSHTMNIAGEIAIMREFGPSAYETYSKLRDMAIESDKASFRIDENKLNNVDRMFDMLMGNGMGIEGNPNIHRFFRNIKDISGAHLLGSIITSQLADNGTALATMRYLGIALDDWGIMKADFYNNPELKRWAKDNIVLIDATISDMSRIGDMATSKSIPSKLLSAVYQGSGSNMLTVIHRKAVAAAISNHIGGLTRDFTWDTLPADRKAILQEKGFDKADFEIMREARVDNGGKDYTLMSIDAIQSVPDSVVTKFVQKEIAEVQGLLADKIAILEKRNTDTANRIFGKFKKFEEIRNKAKATMDRLRKQSEGRIDELADHDSEIAGRMGVFLDMAETETAIAREVGKEKMAGDSAKFMADVKRGVEFFASQISDVAINFARSRAKANRKIGDIDSKIAAMDRAIDKKSEDMFGGLQEDGTIGKVTKAAKDLDAYVAKLQERINKAGSKESTKIKAESLIVEAKQNFQAVLEQANNAIDMLKVDKGMKEADIIPVRDELTARIERARTEMEIADYLLIEKNTDKIGKMLDTLNYRHDVRASKMVTEGERLGYKRAMYDAKLRELTRKEGMLATAEKNKLAKRDAQLSKRVDDFAKEVTEYVKDMQERINEREGWITDYEESLGTKIKEVIENKKLDVTHKLVSAMMEEAHMAVVQPTLSSRAKMTYQKGMIVPEIGAMVTQFKNFPLAVYNQHLIQRLGSLEGHSKLAYGANILLTTTLFGGMGLILGDILQGKDPRKIFEEDNPKRTMKFVLEAMAKGGGLSFFGDWLNMDWEGRDPVEKLAGPGLGMFVSGAKLATSATKFAISGGDSDTGVAKSAIDFGRKFVPAENMWWFRAPLNNYLTAELYERASPGYKGRLQGLLDRNYGSHYWLGMGTEARLPNIGNVTGQ